MLDEIPDRKTHCFQFLTKEFNQLLAIHGYHNVHVKLVEYCFLWYQMAFEGQ